MSNASEAFQLVCSTGSQDALEKVVRSLVADEAIGARFDPPDIATEVRQAAAECARASADPHTFFEQLKQALAERGETVLVAVFPQPHVEDVKSIGRVEFGPAHVLAASDRRVADAVAEILSHASLAIRVHEPAVGARGTRRALQWLRSALGALYLAAHSGGVEARVGPVPADDFAPAIFVGGEGHFGGLVDALRIGGISADIGALLDDGPARELISECLSEDADDFVSARLWAAATWIQVAFDALAYPDAALALGIALEALVGQSGAGDTVKTVSTRVGFLLREGPTTEAWALSGLDWREQTKSVYKARSAVAHGRYEEGDAAAEAATRAQFEDLVCRVAVRFREVGRANGWTAEANLQRWQDELEMG